MARALVNYSANGQQIVNKEYVDDSAYSLVDGDIVNYAVEYSTMGTPNPNIIESAALGNDLMGDDYYDSVEGNADVGGDDFYDAKNGEGDDFADDYMPDDKMSLDGEEYENFTLISKKKRAKLKRGLKKFGKNLEKVGKVGLAALQKSQQGGAGSSVPTLPPAPIQQTPTPKGWAGLSTGAKVAIVGGGLAVLGTIAYFVLNKKK